MAYKLFLDDVRHPDTTYTYMQLPVYNAGGWLTVRDYKEFIVAVETYGIPEVISFDHDLADIHYIQQDCDYHDEKIEKTGYHCAKWFIDYCIDNKKELPHEIIVHSMNPGGSQNIKSLFDTYIKVYSLEHGVVKMNPYLRM